MANLKKKQRRSSMRDKARKRAEENKNSGGGGYLALPEAIKFWKPTKGKVEMEIIPFRITKDGMRPDTASKDMELYEGDLWFHRSIFVHHGIGADDKSYLCPRTLKKKCPICEERAALMKQSDADEELIKDLKPQHKDLFNIRLPDSDEPEKIHLFEFSYANFRKNLEEELREGDEEWAGFAELEEGYALKVRFSESTFMGRKYLEATRIDFDDRDDLDEDILDEVADLEAILKVQAYDVLKSIFLELDGEESDEDDEPDEDEEPEEKPAKKKKAEKKEKPAKKKKAKKEEPEDEDEPEDEPEDEDEPEEEKPAKKKKKKAKKEVEPEDEDEDEEEEEKPAKKSKKKKAPKCPHGGDYADDCDDLEDCMECDLWEECRDAADA